MHVATWEHLNSSNLPRDTLIIYLKGKIRLDIQTENTYWSIQVFSLIARPTRFQLLTVQWPGPLSYYHLLIKKEEAHCGTPKLINSENKRHRQQDTPTTQLLTSPRHNNCHLWRWIVRYHKVLTMQLLTTFANTTTPNVAND